MDKMVASMWRISGAVNRALVKARYVSISWLFILILALGISNITFKYAHIKQLISMLTVAVIGLVNAGELADSSVTLKVRSFSSV